jgi:hypothetical protein
MVERTFPDGLHIPTDPKGTEVCLTVVGRNATKGVTWVHSYVSRDKQKTFCIYDGPDEASIREVATQNGLPIDAVTQVSVLDPYFYQD